MRRSVGFGFPKTLANWRYNNAPTKFIVVTSDGKEVPVDIVVLAGLSPYFKNVLATRRSLIGAKGTIYFKSQLLEKILICAYTGQIELNIDDAIELLQVSHHLKIKPILDDACIFLGKTLTSNNVHHYYKCAKTLGCHQLKKEAMKFMLQHFHSIVNNRSYLKLSFEELRTIISNDHLNVKTEEMVFNAVKLWIEQCPEERLPKISQLLKSLRLGLISLQYFQSSILSWKYIENNKDILDSMFDAQMFHAITSSRCSSEIEYDETLARPRIPYEIIFAIGGWSAGSPTSFMETYDIRSDRWFLSDGSDVTPRAYHGLIPLGHKIYMIGGFDGNEHFSTMRCYDPIIGKWTDKSNMHFPRCYVSCCLNDGKIFAMGGFNGRIRMNSVERYTPETNQWELLPPMQLQRSDASACCLDGKMYIAGGFNGQEVLNSVEVFDFNENQWSYIHPMQSQRSGVVILAFKGYLYAIGGFNGFTRLSTVERYNPKTSTHWQYVADMSSPRSNFAAAVIDDMIFVIGGFNGSTTIPYVECYDENQNEWFDAAHMNLNRSALAACVLRGLPNAKKYSYLSHVQTTGSDSTIEQEQ